MILETLSKLITFLNYFHISDVFYVKCNSSLQLKVFIGILRLRELLYHAALVLKLCFEKGVCVY